MWKLLVKFIHSASNLVDGGIFNALFCENLLINCWKNCENRNGKHERNKSTLVSLFSRDKTSNEHFYANECIFARCMLHCHLHSQLSSTLAWHSTSSQHHIVTRRLLFKLITYALHTKVIQSALRSQDVIRGISCANYGACTILFCRRFLFIEL